MNNKIDKYEHLEIIKTFNKKISESKRGKKRITQVKISNETGINQSHLNKMLKHGSGMHIKYACSIARALGCKLVIVDVEEKNNMTIASEKQQQEQDTADLTISLQKALESEQKNSEFLREQVKWLRSECERLRAERKV